MYQIKSSYQCCVICAATMKPGHIVKPPVWDGHCCQSIHGYSSRAEVIGTSTTKRSFLLFIAFENFMSPTQKPLLNALFKFGKQLSSFYARKLYECILKHFFYGCYQVGLISLNDLCCTNNFSSHIR
jgi:hypothetical protein